MKKEGKYITGIQVFFGWRCNIKKIRFSALPLFVKKKIKNGYKVQEKLPNKLYEKCHDLIVNVIVSY